MVQYILYKSRDNSTPFIIVNENTIDDSSTSVSLVGKRKESYGQPEQQSKLWMLENFANSTKPVNPIQGQNWFNISNNKMYVCVDENTQTFEPVNKPFVGSVAPSGGAQAIASGDLWYNTTEKKLYVYNGTSWDVVGPQIEIPVSVMVQKWFAATTGDASPTEMFINGVVNSRAVIDEKSCWNFDAKIIARRDNSTGEVLSVNIGGTLMRDAGGNAVFVGGVKKEILAKSNSLAAGVDVVVTADSLNQSLKFTVTGEAGKIINWNASVTITKVTTAN